MKKQFLIVIVPIVNLRKEPVEASAQYVYDDLQETQLLYNEALLYKDEKEDWYCVEAVEQKKVTPQGNWQGYPGWIKKESVKPIDAEPTFNGVVKHAQAIILKNPPGDGESLFTISIGTRLVIEDEGNDDYHKTTLSDGQKGWIKKDDVNIPAPVMNRGSLRKNIIETAKLFLSMPYLWGGRSTYVPTAESVVTGVDCSSLTNLVYRVNWLDIPRDAHDQWSTSKQIVYDALEPADLIFVSAEEVHDKITHVMMYLAGEEFIEALETGSVVTTNTFKNKFGLPLHEAAEQDFIVNKRKIYFGSILMAGEKK